LFGKKELVKFWTQSKSEGNYKINYKCAAYKVEIMKILLYIAY